MCWCWDPPYGSRYKLEMILDRIRIVRTYDTSAGCTLIIYVWPKTSHLPEKIFQRGGEKRASLLRMGIVGADLRSRGGSVPSVASAGEAQRKTNSRHRACFAPTRTENQPLPVAQSDSRRVPGYDRPPGCGRLLSVAQSAAAGGHEACGHEACGHEAFLEAQPPHHQTLSDAVVTAAIAEGVPVDDVLCAKNFSGCPSGWASMGSDCLAPVNYSGSCGRSVSFAGFAPFEKAALAAKCDASFPCVYICWFAANANLIDTH